jgi:hypothetical protein
MPDYKNYDPSLITVSFAGIIVQGFMEGTFLTAERNENSFETSVGSQGDTTRVRTRNKSGQVTITLQAESPTNDLLSAQMVLDELTGAGAGALLVKNLNGTTIVQAANAWLMKPANVEYSSDASSREWVIACADLTMLVGGALV